MARPPGYYLGLDFGHNHVHAALGDHTGRILDDRRVTIDVDLHSTDALDEGARLAQTLINDHELTSSPPTVAAGIPGPVDAATGRVRSATILQSWVDLDPVEELQNRIGLPVIIGNDADLGARGEHQFGAAKGFRTFVYIKCSHGIGAGIFIDGHPYRGSTGIAGEIGHTPVQDAAAIGYCRCGNRGCLETVVSVPQVRQQLAHTHLAELVDQAGLADPRVSQDAVAQRVLANAGRTVGHITAIICNLLNPQAIILGGELGHSGSAFAAGIAETISRYAQPATTAALDIRPAALANRSEVYGAIALAMATRISLAA